MVFHAIQVIDQERVRHHPFARAIAASRIDLVRLQVIVSVADDVEIAALAGDRVGGGGPAERVHVAVSVITR